MSNWRRNTVLLGLALAAVGCASTGAPKNDQVAAVPACEGSLSDDECTSGKPLCAYESGDACLMCRCIDYPPLTAQRAHGPTVPDLAGYQPGR
jgi:hypothetical protein